MRPSKRVPANPSYFTLRIHSEAIRPIVPEDNTDLMSPLQTRRHHMGHRGHWSASFTGMGQQRPDGRTERGWKRAAPINIDTQSGEKKRQTPSDKDSEGTGRRASTPQHYYRTLQLQDGAAEGIAQPRPLEEAGVAVRMPGLQEPRSCLDFKLTTQTCPECRSAKPVVDSAKPIYHEAADQPAFKDAPSPLAKKDSASQEPLSFPILYRGHSSNHLSK
ncbi:UNVERIFIED_CONTAM: hypothetical protein FKN15_026119 [Acipenser sinensis]